MRQSKKTKLADREVTRMTSQQEAALPPWVTLWYVLNAVICTWDASFIMFRPHSLPGGQYSRLWAPYEIYIKVDKRYADMSDTFVKAVSLMNYCEVLLSIVIIILSSRRNRSAAPLAFTAAVMIFWKTVLYMLQYVELAVGGGEYHAHNDVISTILILWLPNAVWIVVPFLVMLRLWHRVVNGPKSHAKTD